MLALLSSSRTGRSALDQEPSSLQDVMRLKLTELRVEHLRFFPDMTSWFSPTLLSKLLLNVIVSETFGKYADRRLTHAALDKQTLEASRAETNLTGQLAAKDGEVWIDFVADLGDGFDSTYAMAYLLAQPELGVQGLTDKLPRSAALFMGGDQVYPTASLEAYQTKCLKPYSMAWPNTHEKPHPPIFAIPGNHDWYDGLSVFLALFCRPKRTHFGNWEARQRRSYFSAQLNDNWWVWGIDIALVRNMDQPQADYFIDAAEHMPNGASIILCSAEPGWYVAESEGESFKTLDYAAVIAQQARKDLHIPLVLSGDSHHYARYTGAKSQFITSGGGGAFLHGTLELKPTIRTDWLKEKDDTLTLQSAYPTQHRSRELLDERMSFFKMNSEFSYLLGSTYLLFSFVLTTLYRWDVGLIIFVVLAGTFWGYSAYQEKKFNWPTFRYSLYHGAAHFLAIWLFSAVALWLWSYHPIYTHWLVWLSVLAIPIVPVGARIAGCIFGQYLKLTCKYYDRNHNDAFSSMRLNSYKNFLRIKITHDEITVYPIGLDTVPRREQWTLNASRDTGRPSIFALPVEFKPHLIEPPIRIKATGGLTASEIKPGAPAASPH
jgi:hypothetical protein